MTPEQFCLIADPLPEAMLLVSCEGHIIAGNRAGADRLGTSAADLQGRLLDVTFADPPEDIARYLRLCSRSRQLTLGALTVQRGNQQVACRTEGSLLQPKTDTTAALIMLRLKPQQTAVENFVSLNYRIEELSREVQHRKLWEHEAREQRERLWITLQSIGDGVIVTDADGCVSVMNPVAESLTGWTHAESLGYPLEKVFTIVNEETRQPVPNPALRALRDGIIVGLANHTLLISRDGSQRAIDDSAAPIRDNEQKIIGAVLIFRDITERKQTEQAVLRRSQQLRQLAQVAAQLNTAQDVASVVGIINEEARSVIGARQAVTSLTAEHNRGRALHAVSHEHSATVLHEDPTIQPTPTVSSLAERLDGPVRLSLSELQQHPAWQQLERLTDVAEPERNWLGISLVSRAGRTIGLLQLSDSRDAEFSEDDESVLVQLAQMASTAIENARLMENLRDADRRKDQFLATLAHELRNPLAPIRTGLELMKMSMDDPSLLDDIRGTMERQTEQLIALVDDLLEVSRITQGKLELRRTRVQFSTVMRSAVEAARPLIDEASHELIVSVPQTPVVLDADPHRLAQIISNLLNNAARYTPEGGQIWLTAQRDGDDVIISVRDTGVGIPAEMLDRIFEMFTQIPRPKDRVSSGLGIGLALVKSLVDLHGGQLTVHSEGIDQGSEFQVRLPLLTEQPDTLAEPEDSDGQPADRQKRRVLVVDDNRAAARMLSMVVEMLGNEVWTAADGQEAVEMAGKYRPDVVLMDLGMPRMNGYDAAQQIRRQPWGEQMLLVALTGWGQEEDRNRTKDAGFNHHLVKPATPEQLKDILNRQDSANA